MSAKNADRHKERECMKIMKLEMPVMAAPKSGGMIDAINHDRFIEWLSGEWPTDWKLKRDQQIENETDDLIIEQMEQ